MDVESRRADPVAMVDANAVDIADTLAVVLVIRTRNACGPLV